MFAVHAFAVDRVAIRAVARGGDSDAHGRAPLVASLTACMLLAVAISPADAQQTTLDVLSFLLTNRTIITGDFDRDAQAAETTRDTIAAFLTQELATLPVSSSSGGFTYRVDGSLGTVVRSSDTFGPFYTERSLTAGRHRASFSLGYQSTTFDAIDGRDLRDGTLVSTAATLNGTAFDVETVSLRIRTDVVTFTGNYGVTDDLDFGFAVPVVRLNLQGERVDTYHGQVFAQASGSASASGLGDVMARLKFTLLRDGASGVAVGAEARLPTGDENNLLGAGRFAFTPRVIGSIEGDSLGFHGELSYTVNGLSNSLGYGAGVTLAATPRLTVVGELSGRRLEGLGRLSSTTLPHPRLIGVDTIRLTAIEESTNRFLLVGGVKWNVTGTWLLTANVRRTLTDAGLNAGWVPTVAFDYSFGG